MADESIIIPWNPPQATKPQPKPARVTKPRKPAKAKTKPVARAATKAKAATPADHELPGSEALIAPDFMEFVEAQAKRPALPASARLQAKAGTQAVAATPVAPLEPAASTELALPAEPPAPEVVARDDQAVRPRPRLSASSLLLRTAALALAGVGMAMNGWFAQSLGSSNIAGWLFLAIGLAADLVALVMPTCAARLWHERHHSIALAGWAVWTLTFVFAVTAGIGFASTNISEVSLARASRMTPAIAAAQAQLTDAMAARDRECKGGVGKYCREREAAVAERRHAFDAATREVAQTADPQTEAAVKLVAWLSHGLLKPEADDFAMLRLVLLALLPQFGGILLMVGRRA
ncbi:hypothetical protein [Bradyrhizobium sp. STM 3557]|uniref:hypothetical protein n=1 Tax=Bradyrhizobium sp. STM 3557 TaxID=578920 RepID=UPI003890356A